MQPVKTSLTALLFLFLFLSGCSKSNTNTPPPAPTKGLIVQVFHNDNLPVAGVMVKLFRTNDDLFTDVNIVDSGTSDAAGKVLFSGLTESRYYFVAQKGCENNYPTGEITLTGYNPDILETYAAIIVSAGALTFVNTSADPYLVFINDNSYATVQPMSSITTPPIFGLGAYDVHVVQNVGAGPGSQHFAANVTCGGTFTTTFP
jgi:hypothetical protein